MARDSSIELDGGALSKKLARSYPGGRTAGDAGRQTIPLSSMGEDRE